MTCDPSRDADPLKKLLSTLPPQRPIWCRSEPDYYGASRLIAEDLGKPHTPVSFAIWQHGWIVLDERLLPSLVSRGERHLPRLVTSENHVRLLRDAGYENAHATGLPFIYNKEIELSRLPDSLLVLPTHTIRSTTNSQDFRDYVNLVKSMQSRFSHILACIHGACVEKNYWVDEFEEAGIPWVRGADPPDGNSLARLQRLFRSFEFVTTNGMGSHVPYAAFSGAKVSIFGPPPIITREEPSVLPLYKKFPGLLDLYLGAPNKRTQMERYESFFCHPTEATIQVDWAKQILGFEFKKTSKEIAALLGWTPIDQVAGYLRQIVIYAIKPSKLRILWSRWKGRAP